MEHAAAWRGQAWAALHGIEDGLAAARTALGEAARAEWVSDAGDRYRQELAAQQAQLVRLSATVAELRHAVVRHGDAVEAARSGAVAG